ncbi:hypothetical protein ABUK73_02565 [Agrobacterium sp. BA1120]|uniref:hypothetical protein n=1 Tax=Agrobacterium sp. BA1120 TaxID=3228927 RepID=UPI003369D5EE
MTLLEQQVGFSGAVLKTRAKWIKREFLRQAGIRHLVTENLPDENDKEHQENGRRDGGRFLAINNLHYHANDISELRKLAELDPLLAEKIIEQRDRESARITASYNFGLLCTIILLITLLVAVVSLLIFLGILETMVAIVAILALALLVKVILTGEWSETSWFGKIISVIIRTLGGST